MIRSLSVAMVLLAAMPCVFARAAGTGPDTGAIVARCVRCHGPAGNSSRGDVPRLNGQQQGYLVTRLDNFLDPAREDPHATKSMWSVVSNIDKARFPEIAAYFASQPPTPAAGTSGEGARLYAHGSAGVPACQSCHGARGDGGVGPRLAGQHKVYLVEQMMRMRLGIRTSDTMHPNLKAISDGQIEAIARYLAND